MKYNKASFAGKDFSPLELVPKKTENVFKEIYSISEYIIFVFF